MKKMERIRKQKAKTNGNDMNLLLRVLGIAVAVYVVVENIPGISVGEGWITIGVVALVWSVITLVIRPLLRIITFPITIVTFGLFSFVLNALLFWAMTLVVPSFYVAGFIPALVGAFILSLCTWFLEHLLP